VNRTVFVSLAILCLLSVSSVTGLIRVVKADGGTIYIKADGSIDPTTAPVNTLDNVTYVLVDNISEGITVQRSNIVIDGNGYTLTPASGNNCAFNLTSVNNVTITNATLTTLPYSVTLYDQNIPGFLLVNTNDSEIISNNIAGRPFWDNAFLHAISLTSCFSNNVSSNGVAWTTDGIGLFSSDNNVVFNNHLEHGVFDGIGLYSSNNNTLNSNYLTSFSMYYGAGGSVRGSIELSSSNNNNLIGNNVTGNGQGINLESSHNNVLIANSITGNIGVAAGGVIDPPWGFGIRIVSSSDNTIYHNDFIGNVVNQGSWFWTNPNVPNNVETDGSTNTWDNGYPSGGNYWSDHNGINAPYVINANNTDHYPLMVPYTIPEFPSFLILPLFLIATLAVIIYKRNSVVRAMPQRRH
jgi:parallel beta-helix repeat protein